METTITMDITKYIIGKVRFDEFGGGYLWDDENHMIGEVRGFGRIQNIVTDENKGVHDYEGSVDFQNKVGAWIADAINEKLEKENYSRMARDKEDLN